VAVEYFTGDINAAHPAISQLIFDTILWGWGGNTIQAREVPYNIFRLNSKWAKLCRSEFNRIYLLNPFQYRGWYLTPCYGLEVQYPTQALTWAKNQGNSFDLIPQWLIFQTQMWAWGAESHPKLRWIYGTGIIFDVNPKSARALPLWILHNIFIEPTTNMKVNIWHPAVDLMCRITPRHLNELMALAIPLP
jgi:hypothetical protein